MLVTIQGKNVQITDAMRERAERKLSTIDKYFKDPEATTARVLVKIYNEYQKVEVTVNAPVGLLRAEVKENDFYSALDRVVDKLEDQIRRQKTRLSRKHNDKLSVAFLEEMQQFEDEQIKKAQEKEEPVRTKEVFAEKMDLSTAIMNMEMLNHDFFAYTDDETSEIAVVYKRHDGGYGLLELEKDPA